MDKSHPAWVCGLKQTFEKIDYALRMSHPAWVCGLKQYHLSTVNPCYVTPCVGVWIET